MKNNDKPRNHNIYRCSPLILQWVSMVLKFLLYVHLFIYLFMLHNIFIKLIKSTSSSFCCMDAGYVVSTSVMLLTGHGFDFVYISMNFSMNIIIIVGIPAKWIEILTEADADCPHTPCDRVFVRCVIQFHSVLVASFVSLLCIVEALKLLHF